MPITNTEQAKTASIINVIAAVWLIISPYVLGFSDAPAATNAIWVGIIVGIIALARAFAPSSYAWLSWINAILGLWLIVSSFVLGSDSSAVLWNSIVLGIIVIAISSWGSSSSARLGAGTA